MIRESLADSNQIQWQVLAKSLQLQLTDSRLWQVLYIYSSLVILMFTIKISSFILILVLIVPVLIAFILYLLLHTYAG